MTNLKFMYFIAIFNSLVFLGAFLFAGEILLITGLAALGAAAGAGIIRTCEIANMNSQIKELE